MSPNHPARLRHVRYLAHALAAALCLCLADVARADSTSEADGELAPVGLFSPTLGRPLFVEPGRPLLVVVRAPRADESATFDLIPSGQFEPRYRLEPEPGAADKLATGQPLRLSVPPDVPPRTYDLEINAAGLRLLGRHCVAVHGAGRVLRVVHLSNMNIGDAGAPSFDQRLIDEVRPTR